MNYGFVAANEKLLADQRDIHQNHKTLYVPAVGGMANIHDVWTISDWARYIAIQRQIGGDGIAIYRVGDLDHAVAAFLGNGPFGHKASYPEALK